MKIIQNHSTLEIIENQQEFHRTSTNKSMKVIKINETTILHTGGSDEYVDWTKFQNLDTKSTSNGPSLLTGRSYHGCGKLKIAGKTYLMVVGGQKNDDTLLKGSEFLDLRELVWKKGILNVTYFFQSNYF